MKVAIVHYWLSGMRGGEYVLENILDLFPDADIFTHVFVPEKVSEKIKAHKISTTFINSLPFAKKHYPKYLMLMPRALERLDLSEYDIVISSESGPAKGTILPTSTPHFCYCHSPMRYAWDQYHSYRGALKSIGRFIFDETVHRIRIWDAMSAQRVDHFVANSRFVKSRIKKFYRRDATVIHPPVDIQRFVPCVGRGSYYLFVSELVKYKRADLAIAAFANSDRKLVIVGDGPERAALEQSATPNVQFVGRCSDDDLAGLYRGARALVFPGIEDFGIVPLEAMACGRPVVAFRDGGACDSVIDGVTGMFFDEQSPEALLDALETFERDFEDKLDPNVISAHARKFSPARFKREFATHLVEHEPRLRKELAAFLMPDITPELRVLPQRVVANE